MPMIKARDGTQIYAKSWGEGPPVVLIHGWPLSGDSWDPITQSLAENGFCAIAYDRRGFGRSDQPSGGYDYDTFADDLAQVIDHFSGGQSVALVGFSMGGGEIARFLSRFGAQSVSRVVLISSIVPFMMQTENNPDGVPPEIFGRMTEGLLADRADFFRDFFKQFFGVGWLDHPVSQGVLDHHWQMAMQAGLRSTLAAAEAFATTDFRSELPNFIVPTLVIHGTADKTVPFAATAQELVSGVAQAELIEYPGAAHGIIASHQERLKEDLLAFLQGRPTSKDQELIDIITEKSIAVDPL